MKVKEADFVKSSQTQDKCPEPKLPEYAFIGRSNVGKSSLINALVNRKDLAKTSGKPGKTQLINHFVIDKSWYLVDLPGYGWASVGKQKREIFHKMIRGYIAKRVNLCCTFVLIDIRHKAQENDLEFMEWMGQNGFPFIIVFTKSDKLKETQVEKHLADYQKVMLETWEDMPQYFVTSSAKRLGLKEILRLIGQINADFDPKKLK